MCALDPDPEVELQMTEGEVNAVFVTVCEADPGTLNPLVGLGELALHTSVPC